jgi:hypothetical protein
MKAGGVLAAVFAGLFADAAGAAAPNAMMPMQTAMMPMQTAASVPRRTVLLMEPSSTAVAEPNVRRTAEVYSIDAVKMLPS